MRLTRRFSPKMVENKWGVIINISSLYGDMPSAVFGGYAMTKSGLNGWSASCSKELRPQGVKVVCIQPGPVATEMMRWESIRNHTAPAEQWYTRIVALNVRLKIGMSKNRWVWQCFPASCLLGFLFHSSPSCISPSFCACRLMDLF